MESNTLPTNPTGRSFSAMLLHLLATPPPLCAHCEASEGWVQFGSVMFCAPCYRGLEAEFIATMEPKAKAALQPEECEAEEQEVPWS
jgi:hypothetical protein